jgi:hypothetical protein
LGLARFAGFSRFGESSGIGSISSAQLFGHMTSIDALMDEKPAYKRNDSGNRGPRPLGTQERNAFAAGQGTSFLKK